MAVPSPVFQTPTIASGLSVAKELKDEINNPTKRKTSIFLAVNIIDKGLN
jgi:hypothetical protein